MKLFHSNPVKESIDRLPGGVCFFDKRGVLILCNRVMSRFVFAITGCDLQSESDIITAINKLPPESIAVRSDDLFILPDNTAWKLSVKMVSVTDGTEYTEYSAADVTELHEKRQMLRRSNEELARLAEHMQNIVENVTAITREEEILTMKMQIHNEVGWCLQAVRRFYTAGCPDGDKEGVIEQLQKITSSLLGEIGNSDDEDLLGELCRSALSLGVKINISGDIPHEDEAVSLIAAAIRECVTNTLRHAGGDSVFADIASSVDKTVVSITNNGKKPQAKIVEGGGFTSLRRKIESAGGTMTVYSLPEFRLVLIFK